MTRPLQPGDPATFGPFTVDARLADSPSGVVFLGSDGDGRRAAIATLTGPAAEDPAMQARFREVADPAELYDGGDGVRVLAANLDAHRPWIATAYDGIQPGAERVFEELASGHATARYFQPFTQYPAQTGYVPQQRRRPGVPRRAWWWWVVVSIILVGILLLMLFLFAQCGGGGQPDPSRSPTGSPTGSQSPTDTQSPTSAEPSTGEPSDTPTSGDPSETQTGSPSPSGTGSSPGGTGEPTGAPLRLPLPPR